MKERIIRLNDNYSTVIEEADFALVSLWKWFYSNGYVSANNKYRSKPKSIKMHRYLLAAVAGQEVDHINGDPLDNRRLNLRFATRMQNMCNRCISSTNTSGFKGVSYDKSRGTWRASLTENKRAHNLGRFATAQEAARVYDEAALRYHGEYARLNFPLKEGP